MAEFCRNHNIDATKLSDDQRSKLKASTSDDFDARRMEDRELAVSKRRTLRAAVANGQFVIVSADTIIEAGKDPEFSRLMMQEGQGKSPNLHRDYLMARSRLLMATYGGIDNWMPYQISNGPRHYFAHIFRGQQGDEFFPARDAMNKARLARAEALLRIVK